MPTPRKEKKVPTAFKSSMLPQMENIDASIKVDSKPRGRLRNGA